MTSTKSPRDLKIIMVVGTRPNLVKAAPVYDALVQHKGVEVLIAHTGQHYDPNMDCDVARSLGLPSPTWQSSTSKIGYEGTRVWLRDIFRRCKPDAVIVIGDVDSTYHAAMAGRDASCAIIHVESGLRSGDTTMPEERNRIAVDKIAHLLLATEQSGVDNLQMEGVPGRIELVGSFTVDALVRQLPRADADTILREMKLQPRSYALATIHRQSNVDSLAALQRIVELLQTAIDESGLAVVWPIHPRTRKRIDEFSVRLPAGNLQLCEPVDYTRFIKLMKEAALILTDSGGIQEETTYLGIRCITFRDTTERPATILSGTNDLLPDLAPDSLRLLLKKNKKAKPVEFWDGKASQRAARCIIDFLAATTG